MRKCHELAWMVQKSTRKFIDLVLECKEDARHPDLLDLGSYSLHTVHIALKCGEKATYCNLDKNLKVFCKLFHETSARRGNFITLTDCRVPSRVMCSYMGWQCPCYEKNLEHLKYVEKCRANFTDKTAPDSVICHGESNLQGPFTWGQNEVFSSQLKPFPTRFQTDPNDSKSGCRIGKTTMGIMSTMRKPEHLELIPLDFTRKENLLYHRHWCLHFAQACLKRLHVSMLKKLDLQIKCLSFFAAATVHIVDVSLVQHQLASLDLQSMGKPDQGAAEMFRYVFTLLQEAKWLDGRSSDVRKQEYKYCFSGRHWKNMVGSETGLTDSSMDCLTLKPTVPNCEGQFSCAWSFFKVKLLLREVILKVRECWKCNR